MGQYAATEFLVSGVPWGARWLRERGWAQRTGEHVLHLGRRCPLQLVMSALGQKQTYAVHQPMSALPPIATAKADIRFVRHSKSGVRMLQNRRVAAQLELQRQTSDAAVSAAANSTCRKQQPSTWRCQRRSGSSSFRFLICSSSGHRRTTGRYDSAISPRTTLDIFSSRLNGTVRVNIRAYRHAGERQATP